MALTIAASEKKVTVPRVVTEGDLGAEYLNFIRFIQSQNLSGNTLYAYCGAIAAMADFLTDKGYPTDVEAIKVQHLQDWMIHLGRTKSSATANQRYRGAQRFFNWYEGVVEDERDPAHSYRSPFHSSQLKPPKVESRMTDVLSVDDMRAILTEAGGKTFEGRRDEALILVFFKTGARRAEVANMKVDDVDMATGIFRVVGKGDRERQLWLDDEAVEALSNYLRLRNKHVHRAMPWMWLGRKGRLTDSGIAQVIRDIGLRVGIPNLHPHQFRHSWNAHADSAGLSIDTRMALAGWKSDKMPRHYGAQTQQARAIEAARGVATRVKK